MTKEIALTQELALAQQFMGEARLALITQKTPKKLIKYREGPKGLRFPYVEGADVIAELNAAFGHNWDFRRIEHWIFTDSSLSQGIGGEVMVLGELTIRVKDEDDYCQIVKQDYGSSEIKLKRDGKTPVSIANDLKGGATDCIKRCARQLGFHLDLYKKEAQVQETVDQIRERDATERADSNILASLTVIVKRCYGNEKTLEEVIKAEYSKSSVELLASEGRDLYRKLQQQEVRKQKGGQ